MIEGDLVEIWVYLSASPLTGLTMTLVSYLAAYFIYQKSGYNSLLNPVLVAVVLIIAVLWITGTKYLDYFEGAQFDLERHGCQLWWRLCQAPLSLLLAQWELPGYWVQHLNQF